MDWRVDDIYRYAGRSRGIGEPHNFALCFEIGNGHGGALEIPSHPWASDQLDCTFGQRRLRKLIELDTECLRDDGHPCPGGGKQFRLPGRGRTSTDDEAGLIPQIVKDRQFRQRCNPRRPGPLLGYWLH